MEIDHDGKYLVSEEDIRETVGDMLDKCATLSVGAIWTPLLGAGVGPLTATQSLSAILDAIVKWNNESHKIVVTIVLFNESHLLPNNVLGCIKEKATGLLDVEEQYPIT